VGHPCGAPALPPAAALPGSCGGQTFKVPSVVHTAPPSSLLPASRDADSPDVQYTADAAGRGAPIPAGFVISPAAYTQAGFSAQQAGGGLPLGGCHQQRAAGGVSGQTAAGQPYQPSPLQSPIGLLLDPNAMFIPEQLASAPPGHTPPGWQQPGVPMGLGVKPDTERSRQV